MSSLDRRAGRAAGTGAYPVFLVSLGSTETKTFF
jgi:hypothetical protein